MKFTIKTTGGKALKKLAADVQSRIENVGRAVGRSISDHATHEVQKRLSGGGWIRIYREAIQFLESTKGDNWAIVGLSETELSEFPADESLGYVSGDGGILAAYQAPGAGWPLDLIPPVKEGYKSIIVQMAPASAVEEQRAAKLRILPNVIGLLGAAGFSVDTTWQLPVYAANGIFADIAYLARRLELGASGFPRVAHWGPTTSKMRSDADSWATDPATLRLVEKALKGKEPGRVAEMSEAYAADLARLRAATWP